ncbi:unnamed protein product [Chondrus crispus]|uniref:Uncharacterized protein n=1 Tax=Chondrus crispus TaxID=2769 RepID=R7Q0D9_CHOCR|nr:unnamed protein product [Chondrus crispus]CDF32117.1 unnamed protein product [Chondrus crispus]|eukprot:XP_005711782.1 unnamed protein product [Chondrus crispus]
MIFSPPSSTNTVNHTSKVYLYSSVGPTSCPFPSQEDRVASSRNASPRFACRDSG